jgi:hypothetical protein
MNMRGQIKNSGCVSNATHHALMERRKGGCPWDAEVYQLKKNGERYAKPLQWVVSARTLPKPRLYGSSN